MVLCHLVPKCSCPRKDLVTPRNQEVSNKIATRLRQRKFRQKGHSELCLRDFPWNAASRGLVAGKPQKTGFPLDNLLGCRVCHSAHRKDCTCAAHLAATMSRPHLSSFVDFVRAPTTPVYEEDSPDDQHRLQAIGVSCLDGCQCLTMVSHTLIRFALVSALSGRLETIESVQEFLVWSSGNSNLLSAIGNLIAQSVFFRGGCGPGNLKKTNIPQALQDFLHNRQEAMSQCLTKWASDISPNLRYDALRELMNLASIGACSLGMRDYFVKCFMEICLLVLSGWQSQLQSASLLSEQGIARVSAKDFDELADIWPVGSGIATGIKLIFPDAHTVSDFRQCLRALQRSLGGGTRHVPTVRLSAFLCLWQGCLNGSYPWPISVPAEYAPIAFAGA